MIVICSGIHVLSGSVAFLHTLYRISSIDPYLHFLFMKSMEKCSSYGFPIRLFRSSNILARQHIN